MDANLIENIIYLLVGLLISGVAALSLLRSRSAQRKESEKLAAQIDTLQFEKTLLMRAQDSIMFVFSESGLITLANKQAHTFLKKKTLINTTVQEAVEIPEVLEVINEAADKNELIKKELTITLESKSFQLGEVRSLFLYVKPLEDEGEGKYTRVLISDITEQHRSDQIRKDFLANASHELKTPLAIINGYVETLLEEGVISDQETSLKFLGVMKKHGKRLAKIIDKMLLISKLESGVANTLKYAPFQIKECIEDCLGHLDPLIKEKNISVEVLLEEPDLTLNADRFYWNQILINLVENAIKQNPQAPLKIQVGSTICKESESVILWISDNGVGIPASDLPFIFRRFYRVEKHHSQNKIKGTGLGLSIVKRAIESHGGTISCDSVQNQETRFTITLPSSVRARDLSS